MSKMNLLIPSTTLSFYLWLTLLHCGIVRGNDTQGISDPCALQRCTSQNLCYRPSCTVVNGKATCVSTPLDTFSSCNDQDATTTDDACVPDSDNPSMFVCKGIKPGTEDSPRSNVLIMQVAGDLSHAAAQQQFQLLTARQLLDYQKILVYPTQIGILSVTTVPVVNQPTTNSKLNLQQSTETALAETALPNSTWSLCPTVSAAPTQEVRFQLQQLPVNHVQSTTAAVIRLLQEEQDSTLCNSVQARSLTLSSPTSSQCSVCHSQANCIAPFVCRCRQGLTGNGRTCEDSTLLACQESLTTPANGRYSSCVLDSLTSTIECTLTCEDGFTPTGTGICNGLRPPFTGLTTAGCATAVALVGDDDNGMDGASVVGIVLGGAFLVCFVVCVVWCIWNGKKADQMKQDFAEHLGPSPPHPMSKDHHQLYSTQFVEGDRTPPPYFNKYDGTTQHQQHTGYHKGPSYPIPPVYGAAPDFPNPRVKALPPPPGFTSNDASKRSSTADKALSKGSRKMIGAVPEKRRARTPSPVPIAAHATPQPIMGPPLPLIPAGCSPIQTFAHESYFPNDFNSIPPPPAVHMLPFTTTGNNPFAPPTAFPWSFSPMPGGRSGTPPPATATPVFQPLPVTYYNSGDMGDPPTINFHGVQYGGKVTLPPPTFSTYLLPPPSIAGMTLPPTAISPTNNGGLYGGMCGTGGVPVLASPSVSPVAHNAAPNWDMSTTQYSAGVSPVSQPSKMTLGSPTDMRFYMQNDTQSPVFNGRTSLTSSPIPTPSNRPAVNVGPSSPPRLLPASRRATSPPPPTTTTTNPIVHLPVASRQYQVPLESSGHPYADAPEVDYNSTAAVIASPPPQSRFISSAGVPTDTTIITAMAAPTAMGGTLEEHSPSSQFSSPTTFISGGPHEPTPFDWEESSEYPKGYKFVLPSENEEENEVGPVQTTLTKPQDTTTNTSTNFDPSPYPVPSSTKDEPPSRKEQEEDWKVYSIQRIRQQEPYPVQHHSSAPVDVGTATSTTTTPSPTSDWKVSFHIDLQNMKDTQKPRAEQISVTTATQKKD